MIGKKQRLNIKNCGRPTSRLDIVNFAICILIFALQHCLYADTAMIHSVNRGEITPKLGARSDVILYFSGCQEMGNMFCHPQGGAKKRPGTLYLTTIPDSYTLIEEIPPVPPALTREEALIFTGRNNYYFYDPNYEYLGQESIDGSAQGNTCTVDLNGNIAAASDAYNDFIWYWDADMNLTKDKFQPQDAWGAGVNAWQWCSCIRFNSTGAYLYAIGYAGSQDRRLYKFNVSTGIDEWMYYSLYSALQFYIDSLDNAYLCRGVAGASARSIDTIDADGNLTGTVQLHYLCNFGGVLIDEDTDRLYTWGESYTMGTNFGFSIGAINTDGSNIDYFSRTIGGTKWEGYAIESAVLHSDGFLYAGGIRGPHGVDGAQATLFKLNSELVLQASYDTTDPVHHVEFNADGELVVETIDEINDTADFTVLDTDFNIVDTFEQKTGFTIGQYGNEFALIDHITAGTPGTPGLIAENKFGTDITNPVRLIDFVQSAEDPYVIEMGNEYFAFLQAN